MRNFYYFPEHLVQLCADECHMQAKDVNITKHCDNKSIATRTFKDALQDLFMLSERFTSRLRLENSALSIR